MDKKDLEAKISERKKEAERRRIESVASDVAKALGKFSSLSNDAIDIREDFLYEGENLRIEHSWGEYHGSDGVTGGGHTYIDYRGKRVFEAGGSGITAYVPGDDTWEKALTFLYHERASPILAARYILDQSNTKAEEEKKFNEEKAKWGL